VRSLAANKFSELMASEREAGHDDRLDVYEYLFALAISKLRVSTYRQACSKKKRAKQIAFFEKDAELSDHELEKFSFLEIRRN
jgi:hypothetical protein